MKTAITNLLRHPARRAFTALLGALAFVAGAGSCLAAKNSPPTAQNLSVVAAANRSTPIVLLGSEPNGDPLTFSIVTPPAQGTLSGTAPNLIYTPRPDILGPDSFTYVVSDGKATSNPATVSIVVKVGLSINDISVIEGTGGNTAATFSVTLSANPGLLGVQFRFRTIDGTARATDADYLAIPGSPVFLTAGPVTPITISVLADTRVEPDETFFVELFDPSNNAVILNGTGRCTIVNDDRLNQPPTASDLSVAAAANRSTPIVLQGSDPDGDSLTFTIVSPPSHGSLSGTGPNLTYTTMGLNSSYLGPDSFTYVVSDGQATSNPATVNIAVKIGLEINNISVIEGSCANTAAIFTVTLTTKPAGQPVNFSYRTIDGTAVGTGNEADYLATSLTVQNAKPQTLITVPVISDTRLEPDETFFVELFDPSDNAVIVNGTGGCSILNDDVALQPPTALPLSVVAPANLATPIVLQGSDPQGLPLTFSIITFPSRGTLSGLNGTKDLNYLGDALGPDSFTYVASNGTVTSCPTTVSITVKKGLLINNVSVAEGNSGFTTVTFTVTMTISGSELDLVTVDYRTIDGTATGSGPTKTAGADYLTTSGKLVFGEITAQSIPVSITGDTGFEQDESFLVQLSNASPNAVIVSGTGRCTIRNDDLNIVCCVTIGSAELTPENSEVRVGEQVNLSLDWTHPVGWRKLDSVDLLISGDEGTVLRVRWHEAANAFSLLNSAADKFLNIAEAGSPARLETPVANLHLDGSTGGGLPGQTVTIDFSLSFKPQAAGQTFSVEAFTIDDDGNQQGFESVGTITVQPR